MTDLADSLQVYADLWLDGPWSDPSTLEQMGRFLQASPTPFERALPPLPEGIGRGHFTGSALVVGPGPRVALLHHRKLGKWLQFGGHADGDPLLARVALKEAEEESGLRRLSYFDYESALGCPFHPVPFDLDIHEIPARAAEPAHLHYDVRFLLWCDPDASELRANHESVEVGWFDLPAARRLTQEPSMTRQFDKLEQLLRQLSRATPQPTA